MFSPFEDTTRVQLVCVTARVLRNEMRLTAMADASAELSSYMDKAFIPQWSVNDVAMVKRLGLLDTRIKFGADTIVTRSEAAELLRGMYDKIWLK
jgi:hypothetical protein